MCFLPTPQLYHASVNLTTNERINYRRYDYLKDGKGKFYNPYNRGCKNNLLEYFHLKPSIDEDSAQFINAAVVWLGCRHFVRGLNCAPRRNFKMLRYPEWHLAVGCLENGSLHNAHFPAAQSHCATNCSFSPRTWKARSLWVNSETHIECKLATTKQTLWRRLGVDFWLVGKSKQPSMVLYREQYCNISVESIRFIKSKLANTLNFKSL